MEAIKNKPKDYVYYYHDADLRTVKLPKYGSVKINVQNGKIVLVTKEETTKLN